MTEQETSLVHLHLHSEYSLLDGAIRISDLVKKAKILDHKAVALTDHGNMFGALEFYLKCKENGIKPILGCEIYHENAHNTVKDKEKPQAFHLVLLAKTLNGYNNLIKVVSHGYDHFDQVPIVKNSTLDLVNGDLIALSACARGEFGYLVGKIFSLGLDVTAELQNPTTPQSKAVCAALKYHVEMMVGRYGRENYFVELIDNNLEEQKRLLPGLVAAAKFFDLNIVATADAHYVNQEDEDAHMILTAIKNELRVSDFKHRRRGAQFHLYDNERMRELYGAWPDALANTQRIADMCDVKFEFGKYFLPKYPLPGNETEAEALTRLSQEGLEERLVHLRKMYGASLNEAAEQKYKERLAYETDVIISMGFPGYFLIVQDFINWAKKNGIPVGPGRGSGAGSLVAYALKITDLDPIALNLIFERFLNPDRISMPDFDVDFCQNRRDEVIAYVTEKYGKNNVAQITTFGKMKAKAAIRDVGRVLEIGYGKVDRIAKLIPNEIDIKLKDALQQEPRILEEAKKDSAINDMIVLAGKIEGICRHTSVHAAGVVISDGGMENYVPVYKGPDGSLITQFEMKNVEKIGLVKFDFLGLKTLTVIADAEKLIRETIDPNFRIEEINVEDPKVYDLISTGNTVGIFQLESSGMQSLVTRLKPSCFEDLVAIVALFRPGPLGSGMVDDFIECKHGRQKIHYLLPELQPILKDTYGVILYQEQVLKVAADLANYTLGEADLLRRAMGKKKPEEMAQQKSRFVAGCVSNNIKEGLAVELFELIEKFSSYGFNKSHSAAYGLVSYQTAFLKHHFPEQFMAAIMTSDLDNTEKIVRYVEECRRFKFEIIPPDINRCFFEFTVPRKQAITFGLGAVKGLGQGSLNLIIEDRENQGPFKNMEDFCKRVNLGVLGKKTLEILIKVGCFDCFKLSRKDLLEALSDMFEFSRDLHAAKTNGQGSLFDEMDADVEESPELLNLHPSLKVRDIQDLQDERRLLGMFLSDHPLNFFALDVKKFGKIRLSQIPDRVGEKQLPVVCYVSDISERTSKSGKRLIYVTLEDTTGSQVAMMFEGEESANIQKDSVNVALINVTKSFDGASINVRLEKVIPIETVRKNYVRKILVTMSAGAEGDQSSKLEALRELKSVIAAHPGPAEIRLQLHINNIVVPILAENAKVDLSDQFCLKMSDLSSDLRLLY
ncbi:MAG: DNA polymerase III subunit alpha [Oligoflexales bacterium]